MTMLELSSNHFVGKLPSKMGLSLPNLETLYLGYNNLREVIPSSIANASKLTIISLTQNLITGPIPALGDLGLLRRLVIGANNFTGESPNKELKFISSLTNCRYLETVKVSNNQFHGILPASIGNLSSSLCTFRAFGCNIKGPITSEIGNLSSLESIILDNNELTGLTSKVPNFWNLRDLWGLNLSSNLLRGYIPSDIQNLKAIRDLDLSWNQFTVKRSTSKRLLKYAVVPITSVITGADIIFLLIRKQKLSGKGPHSENSLGLEWRRVSYQNLLQATDNFSEINVLGSGSFGSVLWISFAIYVNILAEQGMVELALYKFMALPNFNDREKRYHKILYGIRAFSKTGDDDPFLFLQRLKPSIFHHEIRLSSSDHGKDYLPNTDDVVDNKKYYDTMTSFEDASLARGSEEYSGSVGEIDGGVLTPPTSGDLDVVQQIGATSNTGEVVVNEDVVLRETGRVKRLRFKPTPWPQLVYGTRIQKGRDLYAVMSTAMA
ncbi:unnamed protein product [Fraxinus pennsylvanica]|uniref:Uncharacterized protein n=1 Tax=Fraxinus pennsylvanica TaxID=56036 RepID=A0AAD1ZYU9_9LAMI|nr:unnamed protein product [Fraxinus pennsylvanica]